MSNFRSILTIPKCERLLGHTVSCVEPYHRIFWSVAKAAVLLTRVSPTGRRKYRGISRIPGILTRVANPGLLVRSVYSKGRIRIRTKKEVGYGSILSIQYRFFPNILCLNYSKILIYKFYQRKKLKGEFYYD